MEVQGLDDGVIVGRERDGDCSVCVCGSGGWCCNYYLDMCSKWVLLVLLVGSGVFL